MILKYTIPDGVLSGRDLFWSYVIEKNVCVFLVNNQLDALFSMYLFISRKKLLADLKERRGYSHLKEEALDRTMWRNRFGGGFEPVVRQNTEW
jgi:hypothetical protein